MHRKHGHTKKINGKVVRSRTYTSWCAMKDRCLNKANKDYKYWGKRGIKICIRWLNSFSNFLEDMGPRPPNKTLERINNYRDYKPSNCTWATKTEQNRHKRTTE